MAPESLAVIMPVYNEEALIADVVAGWIAHLDSTGIDYTLHVYDDGSTDRTTVILGSLLKRYPRLAVRSQSNSGHGPTILAGYRAHSQADWLFQIDSDGEMDTQGFAKLWANREKYDLLLAGRVGERGPASRRLVSWFSRRVVHALYGARITDVNSPYRLLRAEKFRELFSLIPDNTFAPNLLVSGFAAANRLRCLETSETRVARSSGQSSIRAWKLAGASLRSLRETIRFRVRESAKLRT